MFQMFKIYWTLFPISSFPRLDQLCYNGPIFTLLVALVNVKNKCIHFNIVAHKRLGNIILQYLALPDQYRTDH